MSDCRGVLVVDDDEAIRSAMVDALGDEGFDVTTARNGAEALAALRAGTVTPCVILLDIMMPVMDGRQFRKEQVQDPALAGIPVVVLTADAHAARKATELGAVAGLPKPIRLERLLDEVSRLCDRA